MQIWQLFIILRKAVAISVTVFSNPTKLTNYLFYLSNRNINRSLARQMMRLERKYLMFSPFDISPTLLYTVLNIQPCLLLNTYV